MSVTVRIRADDDKGFDADIGQLPARIKLAGRPLFADIVLPVMAVSLFILLFALSVFSSLGWLVLAPLLVLWVFLLWRVRKTRQEGGDVIEFGRDGVKVTERGILHDRVWQASYDDFEGVGMRSRHVRSSRGQYADYNIIELVHPEPAKTLPLYARKGGVRPARRLERYAHLFNLPPLVED